MSYFSLVNASMPLGSVIDQSVSCGFDLPFSCSNTTAVENLCCFNAPGGAILQTQFWDTDPPTGPADSWTVHGLWPDYCDGTFDESCDPSREYTNITAILKEKAPSTLAAMQTYWKDYSGNDESFWEHEWGKHGTCMSTLNPGCYVSYQPTDEVPDYFGRAMSVFGNLPSYKWLAAAGILPSTDETYTLAAIQAALKAGHGQDVAVRCRSGKLNELWYNFYVKGSIQTGSFKAAPPFVSGSSCPSSGIRYVPKYATTNPTATPTRTTQIVPTGTGGALSGKGYVEVLPDGFMTKGGNWYRADGTPATYTATPSGNNSSYTLKTSAGPCQVLSNSSLSCASGLSPSNFGHNGTFLTYGGLATFYAGSLPSGQDKGVVYTSKQAVQLQLLWQPL
ncbi:ribonuclease T2-like protein [Xylaria nigripes]|nr:ribonuclease T2-like protein [Xylaria nigripes]